MYHISVALMKFGRAIYRAGRSPEFRALLSITFFLLVSGPVFYTAVEGWRFVDSLYFCVMTMSTIGYGDLSPSSDLAKIFTMLYSIISIGVFAMVVSKLAQAILRIPSTHD